MTFPHFAGSEAGKPGLVTHGPSGPLGIKFCGPLHGDDEPAKWGRLFVQALREAEVPVQLEPVQETPGRPWGSELASFLQRLKSLTAGYNVKILSLSPDDYAQYREPGCLNIGYTMFEADRIPAAWVDACNQMDGMLVPSTWCRTVFERSGVRVPVRVASPGTAANRFASRASADDLRWLRYTVHQPGAPKGRSRRKTIKIWVKHKWSQWFRRVTQPLDVRAAFKFYSVLRWNERENARGLLEAYFAEFHKDRDVCLVLRAYGNDFGPAQQQWIRDSIEAVYASMCLPGFPPLLVATDRMASQELERLHAVCDCFVAPHRSTGFSTSLLDAMAAGKPVITTGFSGVTDVAREENSLLLPYQSTPVFNMPENARLSGDMMWAEPDLGSLRQAMRRVFENRAWAAGIGQRARESVKAEFNWTVRAQATLSAIREICAAKGGAAGVSLRGPTVNRSWTASDCCHT